ncbi:AAA family ATPase [Ochrobactrum sp. S1502_03]|uniref:AAA family ATPase n=1 Tax=Ochrobactrum sp. S1502_03 TaxID=3108451 RepID=UPI0037C75D4F
MSEGEAAAPAPMVAVAPAAPAVDPLRIESVSICAFRAFPHEVTLNLQGKNILIYGENGSGKTSIFQALRHFFAKSAPRFETIKNVFNANADNEFRIGVRFNDGTPAVDWLKAKHPGSAFTGSDPRVVETAIRKSVLDYRALLDTNYIHGDDRPNLFDIVVERILHDFPITVEGGTNTTIGELWSKTKRSIPSNYNYKLDSITENCSAFSKGLRGALDALQPHLAGLLKELIGDAVTVDSMTFSGVTYNHAWFKRDRAIRGQTLYPEVIFGTHGVHIPQNFLNEARLSALALAVYLAGRLACVPTDGANRLKLLVLDDVLIGLDHDNRMPVLRLLQKYFVDWQIVILTHDRVWFDMAKDFFKKTDPWQWLEVKADGNNGKGTPTLKKHNGDVVADALADATVLKTTSIEAAANSARRAFEGCLRRFAEKRSLKLRFKVDPKDLNTDDFLDAIDAWIDGKPSRAALKPVVADLRAMRTGVLNPQSHDGAPSPSTAEVAAALTRIEELRAAISNTALN